MADANDLLFGTAAPGMSFETVGTTVRFRVISQTSQHRREVKWDSNTNSFKQGELQYWNDGKVTSEVSDRPALDPVLTVQTSFSNWEGVSNRERAFGVDDGIRRIFIRGRKAKNSLMDAVRDACKTAGVNKILPGQFGEIVYTSDGPKANKNMAPPKEYTCSWYTPAKPPAWVSEIPAPDAPEGDFDGDEDSPFNN